MFVWPFLFCFVLIFEFWFSRYFSLFWKMDFVSFLFRFCFFLFGFYWKWKWEFMNSRKSAVGIFQTGRLIASAICFVNFYLMGMFLILFPFEFFIGLLLLCIYIFFFWKFIERRAWQIASYFLFYRAIAKRSSDISRPAIDCRRWFALWPRGSVAVGAFPFSLLLLLLLLLFKFRFRWLRSICGIERSSCGGSNQDGRRNLIRRRLTAPNGMAAITRQWNRAAGWK